MGVAVVSDPRFKSRPRMKFFSTRRKKNESRELRGCAPVRKTSLSLQNQRQQREVDLKGREWGFLIHVGLYFRQ